MDEQLTIDSMLVKLQALKAELGGDTRVLLRDTNRELFMPMIYRGATGKADPWKSVSRGGVPCVIIGG